jgi:photosystem II stability/assembly factor-like uncharacterized protein
MKELNINQFQITDVGGEKSLDVELADAVNMYIEGGNIHSVTITDETDMPLHEAPDVEIRGASTEFMRYGKDWLMRWLDKDSIRRVYPIGYNLGIVALSEASGIYTPTTSVGHAMSMVKRASWLIPVGKGNLTEVTASGSRKWMGLAVSNDETKIVSAEYDGYIYISVNSGSTWSQKGVSRKWIALKGGDNGSTFSCIAAVEAGSIYISTDGGATWTEKTGAGTNNWRDVAISDDGVYCYAVTTDGKMFVSTDSGSTWSQNSAAQGKYGYAVTQSVDGAIIYVAQQSGNILISRDKGKTFSVLYSSTSAWKSIKCSDNGQYIYAGNNANEIWYSSDFGETWNYHTQIGGVSAITCSAAGDIVYACVNNIGIYKSINHGTTFSSSHASIKTWTEICCSDNGVVVAASENTSAAGKIHVSNDSGANWLERGNAADYRSVCMKSDGTSMGATIYGGILVKSTNSGLTFTSTLYNSTKNWNGIACIKDFSTIVANVIGGGIYISTDSGANWAQLGIKTKSWNKISISNNKQITSVEADIWVYDTTSNIRNNVIIPEASSICCNGAGDVVFATSIRKGLYRFTSYGSVGGSIQTLADCPMVSCDTTGNYVMLLAGQKAYTSTNMGDSLTDIGVDASWWACSVSRDGTKYAASQEGGYVYVNNGSGWNFDYNTPVGTYYPKYTTSSLYAVANGRSSFEQRTSDSRAWKTVAASADGSIIWAAEESGYVYYSTDAGATFTVKTNSGNRAWRSICCSSDGTIVYAAATGGQVYKSINTGSSWAVPTGCPNASWNSVACADDGIKFVATNSFGYIWVSDDGATMTEYTTMTKGNYTADISGDGTIIYAAKNGGGIVVGKYNGAWSFVAKSRSWSKIEGTTYVGVTSKVFAIENNGYIWESDDSGLTWASVTSAGVREWTSLSVSWSSTLGRYVAIAGSTDGCYRRIGLNGTWERIGEGSYIYVSANEFSTTRCTLSEVMVDSTYSAETFNVNVGTGVTITSATGSIYSGYSLSIYSDIGVYSWSGNTASISGSTIPISYFIKPFSGYSGLIYSHGLFYWGPDLYSIIYNYNLIVIGYKKVATFDSDIKAMNSVYGLTIITENYIYYSFGQSIVTYTMTKLDSDTDPTKKNWAGIFGSNFSSVDSTPAIIATTEDGAVWRWVHGAWSVTYYGQSDSYIDVSCSKSGEKVVAITKEGSIVYSDNQGTEWGTEDITGDNELAAVSVSNDGKSFSIASTTGIWSAPFGTTPGFTATDNSVTDIVNVNGSEIAAFYKGRINSSLSSFVKYSGYFYTGGNVPDTSKIYHNPYLAQTTTTSFTSNIILPAGSYYCYESRNLEYINDITSTEYQDHIGVFADTISNKLIKAYVAYGAPFIEDLFDISLLTGNYAVCNDMVWYSEYCEQFGARLAMANVAEIDVTGGGVDRATNGSFTAGTTGWAGVWTLVTSGGRTGSNRALLNPDGYLRQTITKPECKLILYAVGDISGLRGDFSIEPDPTNAGWYRCISKGYTSGVIEISYQGKETIYIDDIFALEANLYPSSVYMSQIGNYNDFTGVGAGIVKFPANSEAITGIKATGLQLFVIKEDAIGTVSETGDVNNPFAVNEGQYAIGGRYPKRLGDYFCILKEENGKAMVLLFTGGGFVHLNDQWDAPYSYLNAAMPTFVMGKIYTSLFGNKYIIWQDSGTTKWGCIVDGTNKVGTIQMDRMVSGEFKATRCSYTPYLNDSSTDLVTGKFSDVAAYENTVIYCEYNGSLWMSNNGGLSKTEVASTNTWLRCYIKGLYAIAFNMTSFIYSNDAGETWTSVTYHGAQGNPYGCAYNGTIIALASSTGSWYSDDFGISWNQISTEAVDITISDAIYTLTSTDVFKTDTSLFTTIVLNSPLKNGLAICSSLTEILASDDTGVYTSIDRGQTWILEYTGTYRSISVNDSGTRMFAPQEGVCIMSSDKINFVNVFSRGYWVACAVGIMLIGCSGLFGITSIQTEQSFTSYDRAAITGDGNYSIFILQNTVYQIKNSDGTIYKTLTMQNTASAQHDLSSTNDGNQIVSADDHYQSSVLYNGLSSSLALGTTLHPLLHAILAISVEGQYSSGLIATIINTATNQYTFELDSESKVFTAYPDNIVCRHTDAAISVGILYVSTDDGKLYAYVGYRWDNNVFNKGTWNTYTLTAPAINVICSDSGFIGYSYYNAGTNYFKISTDYGATFGSPIQGTIVGSSKTGNDYAYTDVEGRLHIIKSSIEVYVSIVSGIIGFNSDLTKIITFNNGEFKIISPVLSTGYVNKVISTINSEAVPAPAEVTMSILCGDANQDKKFHKIRVLNEKQQNFSIEFMDPVLPTIQGNNSYGLNLSARRFVVRVSPEIIGATINQLSLTYDVLGPDIKRGG